MRRDILLLITISLIFNACGGRIERAHSYFNIEGRLSGSHGGDTVFLKRVIEKGYEFADSTITSADGSFALSAQAARLFSFKVNHLSSSPSLKALPTFSPTT